MNQVNFVNKTGNSYTPKFKHKHENSTVSTKPINTNNSTMNGLDATASYNFAIVNKNNDFKIPTLEMIPIPKDITKIDGERKYSEDGNLICVIKDDGENKIAYLNDIHKTIALIDKKTNKIIQEQGCYVHNSKEVRVYKEIDDKVGYFTDYDERNGKMLPIGKGKHIYYTNNTKKEFIHWLDSKEYQLIERSDASNCPHCAVISASYDEEGNLKEIEEFNTEIC